MRVGIVGAGIAGLAAARTLVRAGHEAVVFERSSVVGGRLCTCKIGPYTFDAGATSVAPRGRALERVLIDELGDAEAPRVRKPIYVHADWRISPGDPLRNAQPRYALRHGMVRLAEHLAAGADVRLGRPVKAIERTNGGYLVAGEGFDALVLTPPLPETERLLATAGEKRKMTNARYRSCLTVMFGFAAPLDPNYFALIDPEQAQPLTWLSIESAKVEGRAPEGHSALVAQLSPRASAWHMDSRDETVVRETLVDVERLFGKEFGSPTVTGVHRWRYSHPEMTASFSGANPNGTRLVVASDGLIGGRTEFAYDVGVQAATALMELR